MIDPDEDLRDEYGKGPDELLLDRDVVINDQHGYVYMPWLEGDEWVYEVLLDSGNESIFLSAGELEDHLV